jgi:hypothetical protein
MDEIKWAKGYSPLLIVATGDGSVGSELIPPTGAATQDRAWRCWRDLTVARLGQCFGGLNLVGILPMRAAHDGELTYGSSGVEKQ